MKTFLALLLTLISLSFFSQTKKPIKTPDVFEPAYILTLKGDTVRGELKLPKVNKFENYEKLFFRDKTKKIRQYLPQKIVGYGYNNYFYTSAFHNNKPCFFKVLSKGDLTLFQIAMEIEDAGNKVEVHDYSVQKNNTGKDAKATDFLVLEAKGIKKQLKELFKTNKELVKKISEQKEIVFGDEIFEAYFNEYNGITVSE